MIIKTRLKIKKRTILLILIFIMVILLFITGYSIGKDVSVTKINSNIEIAKPIFEIEKSQEQTVTKTNTNSTYIFKVKNYDVNENISQVDLIYYIEILNNTNEGISLKLYRNDEEIQIENNRTQEIKIQRNQKQEDNYRLEIQVDALNSKDVFEDIQVKVHSQQMKI